MMDATQSSRVKNVIIKICIRQQFGNAIIMYKWTIFCNCVGNHLKTENMVAKYCWFSVSLLPTLLFSKGLKIPPLQLHKYSLMEISVKGKAIPAQADCAEELHLLFKMCRELRNSSAGTGQPDRGGFSSHETRLCGGGHGSFCPWHAQVSAGGTQSCSHTGVGHKDFLFTFKDKNKQEQLTPSTLRNLHVNNDLGCRGCRKTPSWLVLCAHMVRLKQTLPSSSGTIWTMFSDTWCDSACPEPGVWLDGHCGSLPIQYILWFYEPLGWFVTSNTKYIWTIKSVTFWLLVSPCKLNTGFKMHYQWKFLSISMRILVHYWARKLMWLLWQT